VYTKTKKTSRNTRMEIKPKFIRNMQIGGIIIALGLVAFGIYQTVGNTPFSTLGDKDNQQPPSQEVAVRSTAPTEPLPYLPTDFPTDAKATVVNNYTATSPKQTDATQNTRTYSSSSSLLDLYNTYLSYFTKNNWTISNKALTKEVAAISANKDRVAINISIQQLETTRLIVLSVAQSATPFVPEESNQNGADFPPSSR
jgi:hypothetical protein